jgi:hypothetical protein
MEFKVLFNSRNHEKHFVCPNYLRLEIKKKLISWIWGVALYGSETWAVGEQG